MVIDCTRVPACLHTRVVVLHRELVTYAHMRGPDLHPGVQMGLLNLCACMGMPCCTATCVCRTQEHHCIGMREYARIYEHVLGCMGLCAAVHLRTLSLLHVCTYTFVCVCGGKFMHLGTGFSQRKHKEKDVIKTPNIRQSSTSQT